MKATFLSIVLMSLLVLGSHEVKAQMYEPYAYAPYGDGVQYQPYPYPQQYDPYYDLHVMHYQLYLQQYPGYPIYQPCCFVGGVAPVWSAPIVRPPLVIIAPRLPVFRRR
jgi:hypothetical protein